MNYKVKSISIFEKQAKRLSKKYPSLKDDLLKLVQSLRQQPEQGSLIGKNCYKIRLAISSKNKGTRGGGRVITHFVLREEIVYLLSIYDKSDKESISDNELAELLAFIPE